MVLDADNFSGLGRRSDKCTLWYVLNPQGMYGATLLGSMILAEGQGKNSSISQCHQELCVPTKGVGRFGLFP